MVNFVLTFVASLTLRSYAWFLKMLSRLENAVSTNHVEKTAPRSAAYPSSIQTVARLMS